MDEKDVNDMIPRAIENVVPRKIIKVAFEDIVKKLGDSGAKVYLVMMTLQMSGKYPKDRKFP